MQRRPCVHCYFHSKAACGQLGHTLMRIYLKVHRAYYVSGMLCTWVSVLSTGFWLTFCVATITIWDARWVMQRCCAWYKIKRICDRHEQHTEAAAYLAQHERNEEVEVSNPSQDQTIYGCAFAVKWDASVSMCVLDGKTEKTQDYSLLCGGYMDLCLWSLPFTIYSAIDTVGIVSVKAGRSIVCRRCAGWQISLFVNEYLAKSGRSVHEPMNCDWLVLHLSVRCLRNIGIMQKFPRLGNCN